MSQLQDRIARVADSFQPNLGIFVICVYAHEPTGKLDSRETAPRGRIARRPYRENVSMIAPAIASTYSSSTKWPPSK